MKIFIDVDNTIIEHYGFYSYETESRIHKSIGKFAFDNTVAVKTMYESSVCHDPEIIRELFKKDDVYILTKYPSDVYEHYKQLRVAEILHLTHEELLNAKDKNGIKKYIQVKQDDSKVDVIKELFNSDIISDCILIDDYSQNIIEWEFSGGIGIKYYNEYNSPSHPANGISISNFKIFRYYLEKNYCKNLILVGSNKYKLRLIEKNFYSNEEDVQKIDLIQIVLKDLLSKLKIGKLAEHHKYSYMDFVISYYEFMDNVDKTYWAKVINDFIKENNLRLISSNFEPNFEHFFKNAKYNEKKISIYVLSSEIKRPINVYDMYLTINEKNILNDVDNIFLRLTNIMKNILLK